MEREPLGFYICKAHNKVVEVSTGIHGGLTFGHGELDPNGFWEIDCPEGQKVIEERIREEK